MPRIDSEKFYSSAIEMHGTSARGLNWASKENQELRFDVLLEFLPKKLSEYVIADAGCGFGDLFSFMNKRKKTPKRYLGVDSHLDMYSIASKKTGCEIIIADICKDELPKTDYFLCSGALNVLTKFETRQFIRNCYKASKHGFIFNALHGNKESQTYNYLTRDDIKNYSKRVRRQRDTF